MVRVMGLGKKVVVLMMVMLVGVCVRVSMGAVYKVGDSAAWTNTGHVDYKAWSASKSFHVGDTIYFEYNKQFHNVIRVTHKNFNACNATAPYFTLNSGNDSFTIARGGHFYFICSLPGHCEAGQKVDIRVPRTPPLAPTAAPPPSPSLSPAPHQPPPSPPVLSPLPPVSSPLPSSSPAPAPNVPVSHNSASSLSLPKGLLSMVVLAFSVSGFAY